MPSTSDSIRAPYYNGYAYLLSSDSEDDLDILAYLLLLLTCLQLEQFSNIIY